MFTQLYSPRYTQPIKAYNSVLNKTIHLFKVKDHLNCKIHMSTSYIKHSQMVHVRKRCGDSSLSFLVSEYMSISRDQLPGISPPGSHTSYARE